MAKGGNKIGGIASLKALLNPDKFSSTAKLKFNRQFSRIKKKINSDIRNYSTNSQKITYVQSRIIGQADNLTYYRFNEELEERY